MNIRVVTCFSFLLAFALAPSAFSQNQGDIDLSFGTSGYASTPAPFGGNPTMAIGLNQDIYVCSGAFLNDELNLVVFHLDQNGQMINSYGTNGQVNFIPVPQLPI